MFSKRHYEAIARALQLAQVEINLKEPIKSHVDLHDGVSYARDFLADTFARDNGAFNLERFRAACEPEFGPPKPDDLGANVRARTAYLKPAKVTP